MLCPMVSICPIKQERMNIFIKHLNTLYPDAGCELKYANAYELTAATILSAQCTDKQVNKVTPLLFQKYPNAPTLAGAKNEEVEEIIRSTGFYKNKAKNLVAMAKIVTSEFGGKIPNNMDDLTKLPGVGRKTANVVLGNIFSIPAMVVDTHVLRISGRLDFTESDNPEKVEQALEKLMPKEYWTAYSHQVILLGREFCIARKPKCEICPMNK